MFRIILLSISLVVLAIGFACSQSSMPSIGGVDSPTEAYKRLYTAVKAKDIEGIKANLTKNTIEFGAMVGKQNGTQGDKVYENGFTATTFSDALPTIRDERVADNMGAVEVWNSKESKWEDLPFILEDGKWKLSIGEMFAGTYKSPGRGRDSLEKEASNAISGGVAVSTPVPNINVPVQPVVPANPAPQVGAPSKSGK